jgi:hypothetical protein
MRRTIRRVCRLLMPRLLPRRLQPFAGLSNRFSAASLNKKRTQEQAASSSVGEGTDTADLVAPASESDEEYNSRPKRRSVDVQRWSMDLHSRPSLDRRTSLDKWHEARRIRWGAGVGCSASAVLSVVG